MRNLKKFLALVLAMVMAFSLMLSASAADVKYDDYKDKDSVTAEFEEAVQVLTGLKVVQGDGEEGNKSFRPSDKITRAEAAAIIYRVVTGDVTDRQTDLYKDYSTFKDVKSDDWFAGYVGYCQNAGYIKGHAGYFTPYGQVTGYEVLAMILRAVGYGKNNEFSGSSWQVNVASLSKQLGVTADVVAAHMDQTLNMAAPREVVADLVFMTMATVPMVTYTPALAYNDKNGITTSGYNATLGQQTFGLWYEQEWKAADAWGRPGYSWYKNGARTGWTDIENGKAYVVRENHPLYTGTKAGNLVATIIADYDYETKEQVRECDVAEALKIDVADNFDLYVNSKAVTAENYQVVATDTVTKVGGQGRVSEFYYEKESKWFTEETNVAVMIDTMLARVTDKHDAKLDPAGHVITPAKLEVTIYDGGNTTQNGGTNGVNAQSKRIISKPANSKDNWDDYAKGDYILIHAYTDKTSTPGDAKWGNNVDRDTQLLKEEAAFRTNKVIDTTTGTTAFPTDTLVEKTDAWVEKKAESVQGKQTVTYWNQNKHQVDGTDYPDQLCLFLDKAGRVTNTTFTWFFDLYGNIIGIGDAHAVNFGVITKVYAAVSQGDSDTTGGVKAIATVKYTDGTEGTVEIDRFLMSYGNNGITAVGTTNPGTAEGHVSTAVPGSTLTASNAVVLRPVFDTAAHPALSAAWSTAVPAETHPGSNNPAAWLYMSASTATNTNAHFASVAMYDAFSVLYDNLFEFTVADDNSVVATQVSGGYNSSSTAPYGVPVNPGTNFADKANLRTNDASKLFKNLAYMKLDSDTTTDGVTTCGDTFVYLNNDTQILIRLGSTNTINSYTLETLPGDVEIPSGSRVAWADTDDDNRADVVYIQGANIPSTVTYGLFFYDGGAAQWDAASSTGTIQGYLNGDAETITIKGAGKRGIFNTINACALPNGTEYAAKLFALRFVNGEVDGLLQHGWVSNTSVYSATPYILANSNGASPFTLANVTNNVIAASFEQTLGEPTATIVGGGTESSEDAAITDNTFKVGKDYNNPYTTTTQAVYVHDTNTTAGTSVAHVERSGGDWIEVRNAGTPDTSPADTTYWLAPNVKTYGELDWLNRGWECYVTMVYDAANANAVTEIYITHDPDITPDDEGVAVVTFTEAHGTPTEIQLNAESSIQIGYTAAPSVYGHYNRVKMIITDKDNGGVVAERWLETSEISGGDLNVGTLSGSKYIGTLLLPRTSDNGNKGYYEITVQWYNGTTKVAEGTRSMSVN